MMMNIGVGDFISGAGQQNDALNRLRKRLGGYHQRHLMNANHFDGRFIEETEKQRQETAAYHKKWMDSKAKRTTGKSKGGGGQRGGDGSSAANGCAKPKRKSQNDDHTLLKTPRTSEVGAELVYEFSQSVNCTASEQGQVNAMTTTASPPKVPPAASSFVDPQFYGSAAQSSNQNGSSGTAPNADAGLDGSTSFCKKEPNDDSNGGNAVDEETSDFMGFDEELYKFLDGIGQDGDLPPDILQVLNQGELDNIDFHDPSTNGKDISSAPAEEAAAGGGDVKPSECNLPSSLNECLSTGANQVLATMKVNQELAGDGAGPAAETLKQMVARRNQATPTPGLVFQRNKQPASSQMFNCSMPYSDVGLVPASSNATPVQNARQYAVAMTANSSACRQPPIQSCVQERNEAPGDYYLVDQVNPYAVEAGFFDGITKQSLQSHPRSSSYAHYPPVNSRDLSQFASCFPSQNSQLGKPTMQFAGSNANQFGAERLTVAAAAQKQQYCGRPSINSGDVSSSTLSYLQASARNSNSAMGHQMQMNSGLVVKKLCLPSQYTGTAQHLHSHGPKIKLEEGLTACSTKDDMSFACLLGGQPSSMQSYRQNSVGGDFFGVGYTHEGTFANQLVQRPIFRPNLPPYAKECNAKTPNSGNAYANFIPANQPNVPDVWMNSAALKKSPAAYAPDSVGQPLVAPPTVGSPFLNEYRQAKQCQAIPLSYHHVQRQQVLTPSGSSSSWNVSSESRMGPGGYQSSSNDATLPGPGVFRPGHLYQRQNSLVDRASAMLTPHQGANMILQGQNPGDNRHQSMQHVGSNRRPSAGHLPSVDQFLSCSDADGFFATVNQQKQVQESMNQSMEFCLIDDLVNGK